MDSRYTYIDLVKDVLASLLKIAGNGKTYPDMPNTAVATELATFAPDLQNAHMEDITSALELVRKPDGTFVDGIVEKLDSILTPSAVVMDCDFDELLEDTEVAYCVDKHLDLFTVGAYNAKGGACECCRPYYRESVYLLRAIDMRTGDDITKTVLDRKAAKNQVGDKA
ncbi:hypothetical protein KF4_010 [Vibrio phage vB_VpaS_KF4]|nr:hypothetical protein KF3_073 [Vibrio phage vB_VpaS_KF3]ATI19223.1 hypothetical protein KF4_010 [Vibrio phage vB_VpaS_KF4]